MGLIGVFATFSSAAYHYYLSELINTLSKVFNPKDLSHLKFHFYAIMCGLFFSMFSIVVEDIGITCFESCGTARGSYLEFLYVVILVFVEPYCLWSAIQCFMKLKRDQQVLQDQVSDDLFNTNPLETTLHLSHHQHSDLLIHLDPLCVPALPLFRQVV